MRVRLVTSRDIPIRIIMRNILERVEEISALRKCRVIRRAIKRREKGLQDVNTICTQRPQCLKTISISEEVWKESFYKSCPLSACFQP